MRSHTFRLGDALVFLGHKPHRVSPLRAVCLPAIVPPHSYGRTAVWCALGCTHSVVCCAAPQGQRRVLVVELWRGEERVCEHRCERARGRCELAEDSFRIVHSADDAFRG